MMCEKKNWNVLGEKDMNRLMGGGGGPGNDIPPDKA